MSGNIKVLEALIRLGADVTALDEVSYSSYLQYRLCDTCGNAQWGLYNPSRDDQFEWEFINPQQSSIRPKLMFKISICIPVKWQLLISWFHVSTSLSTAQNILRFRVLVSSYTPCFLHSWIFCHETNHNNYIVHHVMIVIAIWNNCMSLVLNTVANNTYYPNICFNFIWRNSYT